MKPNTSSVGWFWYIFHTAAWLGLVLPAAAYLSGALGANPVQAAMQMSGDLALLLLLAALTCTPLQQRLGWRFAGRLRRPLGLYAFLYALAHFLLFAWADFGWQLDLLLPEFSGRRYLWAGAAAFFLLLLLAATSNRKARIRLGGFWKQIQRLVYAAGVLAVLHAAWAVRGDVLRLSGDIWKPLAAAVYLGVLLLARLPLTSHLKRCFRKGIENDLPESGEKENAGL